MNTQGTYLINEFAKLAGVTVRTLHYYDQTGLLKPRKRGTVRHYQPHDLLRLQQILTLKAMGFTLDEIRALLDDPAYDVQKSLRIQKDAIDRRIEQLQQASRALEQTIAMLGNYQPDDWAHVITIIRIVSAGDKQEWFRRYFSEEQMAQIAARQTPAEKIREGERDWLHLIEAFSQHRHLAPDHPEVQRLAATMHRLIHAFTQGDAGLRASLESMYKNFDQIPAEFRLYDADLQRFMNTAFAIYEERNSTP